MPFFICGARKQKNFKSPSTKGSKGSGSEGCHSIVCDMVCDMVPEVVFSPSSFDDSSQVSMLTSEYIPARPVQRSKRRRKRGFR
mmetsp:Transcript_10352/g.21563  ORF Transcript_10352/g.21563 Transcript_10352/m.21563 type:complete len:84 (+) Transcript_10352:164-415(+)